jgi:hypothetical protein
MTSIATAEKPRSVSRFEASLLRMLRAFVPRAPGEPLPPMPAGKQAPPKELSADCVHLVKDTLSKGCVLYLARAGGWRREKHLRRGQPAFGRLWERTPADELGLNFSQHSLDFLVWLASGRSDEPGWNPSADRLTVGDQFLLFLAHDALRESDAGLAFRARALFIQHGLIRLVFPDDFALVQSNPALDFDTWMEGPGASILEALQPRLAQRLLIVERHKTEIGEWEKMRRLGIAQDRALSAFLTAAQQYKRPDLARFLLRALSELLTGDPATTFWIGGLQGAGPGRLTDRIEVHRHALVVLRHVARLTQWTQRARATGYLDEDYTVAQLWLADWEQFHGDEIVNHANRLLRQLEPLQLGASASVAGAASVTEEAAQQ